MFILYQFADCDDYGVVETLQHPTIENYTMVVLRDGAYMFRNDGKDYENSTYAIHDPGIVKILREYATIAELKIKNPEYFL